MKKRFIILSLCAAMGLAGALSGCGGADRTESEPESAPSSAAQPEEQDGSEAGGEESSLGALADELAKAYPDTLPDQVLYGSELFEKNCKKLYACGTDELSDAVIAFNRSGAVADEVSVVYPAQGSPEDLVKMLEARRDMRWNDFNGYAPDELPKIESARIFTAGGAAVLVISDDAEDIEKLIKEKLG